MQRKDIYNSIIHLLFGIVFLSFPIMGSPDYPNLRMIIANPIGRSEVISQFLFLGYFYLNFFYIIPRYFFKKKYIPFGLITLGILFLMLAWIPLYFNSIHSPLHHSHGFHSGNFPARSHHHHPRRFYMMLINRNMYMFFFVFSVGLLIKITQKWRQSEGEKMNSELSFLKAQINPHFLFNTLNSIYSLSIGENAQHTSEAIIRLSSMMRYVTQEASGEKVSLEKELEYIRSYIELQRIRFGETVRLNVIIDRAEPYQYIAPLILISFIENAFKYGVNPQENSEITIKITMAKDSISMYVKNNQVHTVNDAVLGSGIGIQNTINRLNLLYNGQYELNIDENKETYSVDLKLLLS